ncbi:MAG: large repetitive protein, partial [Gaiellales bacterium]|nr:large repetitive protein [Gaiellales bacterium]
YNLLQHNTFFEPVTLPTTGTYTLSFNPNGANIGSFNVTPYDVPADATNTAIVGGSGVTATTTVPGQNGQISFTTTSNTPVTILYDVTSCCPANISVLLGGVVVKAASSHNPGDSLSFTPAAGTNTYVIKIDPTVNNIGDLTIFVS